MKDLLTRLDNALKQEQDVHSTITINELIIKPTDESQAYKLFYKNTLQDQMDEPLTIEQVGQLCVYSLRSNNRFISSWCINHLLNEMLSEIDRNNTLDQEHILKNNYTLLILWHISQLTHLNDPNSHNILDSYMGTVNQEKFIFLNVDIIFTNISERAKKLAEENGIPNAVRAQELYLYLLSFAAYIDTYRLAKGVTFFEAYEAKISTYSELPTITKQSKFPAFEKTWAEYPDPTSFLVGELMAYVQFEDIRASRHQERFFRIITGRWNQHHNEVVRDCLASYWLGTIPNPSYNFCEYYLEGLRSRLLSAGHTVKPDGTLAQIINFTQLKLGRKLIDINALNIAIIKNNPQESTCSFAAAIADDLNEGKSSLLY